MPTTPYEVNLTWNPVINVTGLYVCRSEHPINLSNYLDEDVTRSFGGDIIPDATTGVDHIPFLDRNYYYAIVALNDVGATISTCGEDNDFQDLRACE